MHPAIIVRILGFLLMGYSLLALVPPTLVSLIYQDNTHLAFIIPFFINFISGAILWLLSRHRKDDLRTRDGFIITALFWTVLGLFGSMPFMFADVPGLNFTDAVFESLSGLTTTGATILPVIDGLPHSILFYRQQLQWLGGIGIIVIAMAILPLLGVGGMQLYRAEAPGPVKDSKLTPRIAGTAKALISIYCGLTTACCLAYWIAGMNFFDAIGHAFSTVAIGGFSTHTSSMGYFQQPAVLLVAIFFMVLAGVNFALHFAAWKSKKFWHYFTDAESRFYFFCLLNGTVITVVFLVATNTYNVSDSFLNGAFQVVSLVTTTGFATDDFSAWPLFLPLMLFIGAFMGGCANSTAGGMKVIRVLLVVKQGMREIQRLIHPNAVIPIKVNNKAVSDRVIDAVWGFFAVYIFVFILMLLVLLATGLDFLTAFSAVGACINNLGPGLGEVAAHYGDINITAKWVLCFAMLLGRLEIFTLLVLFTPMFWRR